MEREWKEGKRMKGWRERRESGSMEREPGQNIKKEKNLKKGITHCLDYGTIY